MHFEHLLYYISLIIPIKVVYLSTYIFLSNAIMIWYNWFLPDEHKKQILARSNSVKDEDIYFEPF